MDIEEMMIDYIMNHASNEEIQEFFGYADYGILQLMRAGITYHRCLIKNSICL